VSETALSWFTIPDACVALILILGLAGGLRRGLSGELFRLLTFGLGLFVAWKGADQAAAWLAARTEWDAAELRAVGFMSLFLLAYTLLSLLRHALNLFMGFSFKGALERVGGAVFGLARAVVFAAVALLAALLIPSEAVQEKLDASRTGIFARDHLLPAYTDWAAENPDLGLPAPVEPGEDGTIPPGQGLDMPAWEEMLGPLIEPEPPAAP
jgi:uncharacterized membrane protein required for colicin V production